MRLGGSNPSFADFNENMTMKKNRMIALLLSASVLFAACGSDKNESKPAAEKEPTTSVAANAVKSEPVKAVEKKPADVVTDEVAETDAQLEAEAEEHEEHKAHEHGAANLVMVVTENGLEIALESPAANVFGFEHKPSTDEQRAIVDTKKDILFDSEALFSINEEAGCKFDEGEFDSAMLEEASEEKSANQHADEDHDEKGTEHKGAEHNDVEVNWNFACDSIDKLSQIEVRLFSAFPEGFEKIKVEWLDTESASSIELTEDGVIELAPAE